MTSSQMRLIRTAVTGGLLVLLLAGGADAAAPSRAREPLINVFPDFERGLVILQNTSLDSYCTPDGVDWEEAVIQWNEEVQEWIDGGQQGPEPPFPPDPPSGFPGG